MILLVDWHNTVVDELCEYGPAIEAALDTFWDLLPEDKRPATDREMFKASLYPEIQAAHRKLGDDWDNRVFDAGNLPSLRALFSDDNRYNAARKMAIAARMAFSKQYIQNHAYPGAVEFLEQARREGHVVLIVTDATEHAIHPAVKWLGLDGVIDGVYCCASPNVAAIPEDLSLQYTPVRTFENRRVKPDGWIVAQIATDIAKARGRIPMEASMYKLFSTDFMPDAAVEKLFKGKPDYASARVEPEDTGYWPVLADILGEMMGIGDDFRDLVMFANAGIKGAHADYSARIPNIPGGRFEIDKRQKAGKAILKAVTGWDEARLNLFKGIKPESLISYVDDGKNFLVCSTGMHEIWGMIGAPENKTVHEYGAGPEMK